MAGLNSIPQYFSNAAPLTAAQCREIRDAGGPKVTRRWYAYRDGADVLHVFLPTRRPGEATSVRAVYDL